MQNNCKNTDYFAGLLILLNEYKNSFNKIIVDLNRIKLRMLGGGSMQLTSCDIKQEIIRINNNLNISMYGNGLRRQKVMILDEKTLIIIADNKRIPALTALDDSDRITTRMVDVALLNEYKNKLKNELKRQTGLPVKCVLKDYDPKAEIAATVIILEVNSVVK